MEVNNSRFVISSNFCVKRTIFTNISSNSNGGVMYTSSEETKCLIKDCIFVFCKTSAREGGALFFDRGRKYEIKCSLFKKNSALYSPNFWISNRGTPFVTIIENLATCQSSKTVHIDVFGGNPLLFKHVNCSDNSMTSFGFLVDYMVPEKHNQFAFVNAANNNLGSSYFMHDQEKMPINVYFDKINFINNVATYFFGINYYKKYDHFYETNFVETTQVPIFNEPVSFYNCYFCFSLSNKQSATIISNIDFPVNIIVKEECRFVYTRQRSQRSAVPFLLYVILLTYK